jgi:ribosome maturation factor RimP
MHFNKVSNMLRVFIDRDKGAVTVEDCRKVSKLISKKIDNDQIIIFPYTLEVSSPGVERFLKRPEHYRWAAGKLVEIDVGEKKIKGYIRHTEEDGVIVATDVGENLVPYSSIVRAKVVEDLEYGKRR